MWPGRATPPGRVAGSIRRSIVVARSKAEMPVAVRGPLGGVGHHRDGEGLAAGVYAGEAAAVDGDRTLPDDVARQPGRYVHLQVGRGAQYLADRVDVALHEVAPEAVGRPYGAL